MLSGFFVNGPYSIIATAISADLVSYLAYRKNLMFKDTHIRTVRTYRVGHYVQSFSAWYCTYSTGIVTLSVASQRSQPALLI